VHEAKQPPALTVSRRSQCKMFICGHDEDSRKKKEREREREEGAGKRSREGGGCVGEKKYNELLF
jgi:hypothetical protein